VFQASMAALAAPEAAHLTGQVVHVNGGAYGAR
jgi:3-oxoacyl-[acyl-carrier protein] reductase